jgi:hypothetical protein
MLFNIPKLADDGLNWITYKERMLTAIGARGLMRYTDGCKVKPDPFEVDSTTKKLKNIRKKGICHSGIYSHKCHYDSYDSYD